jgi:DNA polymerase III alpha subunit
MKTDSLGIPRFSNRDLIDMIYTGQVDQCHVVLCDPSDDVDKFNHHAKENGLPELTKYIPLDVDQKTFDGVCQGEWFMPDTYKNLDINTHILTRLMEHLQNDDVDEVTKSKEWNRAFEEIQEFEKRDMKNLLRYMVYLVDFMRENKIVWGVGRGSSVASYVLYLIGIHRVNSIQFDLDWREFLR